MNTWGQGPLGQLRHGEGHRWASVHRGLKDTGTQRHIDHTGTVQQRQEGHKSHKGTRTTAQEPLEAKEPQGPRRAQWVH